MFKIASALVLILAISCEAHGNFGHGSFGHGGHGSFGHGGHGSFGHGGHGSFGHGGHGSFHGHHHGGFHGHNHGHGHGHGFGGRFFRAIQSSDSQAVVDCFFHWRNATLHCQHATKPVVVDCNIESTIMQKVEKYWTIYSGFAIGRNHFHDAKTIVHETIDEHFHLFPRNKSPATWLNTTLSSDVHLSIYHKPTTQYVGYRVTDFKCWTELVKLFNSEAKFDFITISGSTKPVDVLGYINY